MAVPCLVTVLASCGGANSKPRDAGAADAGNPRSSDASGDTPTTSGCVPVADHAISDPAGVTGHSALAWTGDGYGVVWADARQGVSQIYFARLDATGTKIGADRAVTSMSTDAALPVIAWNGTAFGLAFATEVSPAPTPTEAYFEILAADGTPQGSVVDVGASNGIPSMVWADQTFALAYHSARGAAMAEIFLSRFDESAKRLGTEVQLTNLGFGAFNPAIAWTGNRYGISFQDSRQGETEVFLALVDANGAKIGQEMQLSTSSGVRVPSYIAASSTGFAVTYQVDNPTLVRLDEAGNRTATDVVINDAPAPVLWTGTQYALVTDGTAGGQIFLSTIDASGTAPSTPALVSDSNADPFPDEVGFVWTGRGYGVAWPDDRTGVTATHFAVVCP